MFIQRLLHRRTNNNEIKLYHVRRRNGKLICHLRLNRRPNLHLDVLLPKSINSTPVNNRRRPRNKVINGRPTNALLHHRVGECLLLVPENFRRTELLHLCMARNQERGVPRAVCRTRPREYRPVKTRVHHLLQSRLKLNNRSNTSYHQLKGLVNHPFPPPNVHRIQGGRNVRGPLGGNKFTNARQPRRSRVGVATNTNNRVAVRTARYFRTRFLRSIFHLCVL